MLVTADRPGIDSPNSTVRSQAVRPMKLRCTNCPAELELGSEGRDTGDVAYKLLCPVLRDHFKNDVDVDCPYMRAVTNAAALRGKRRR